jgi:hypothetical protein
MSEVIRVVPQDDYLLDVELDDGRKAVIDVKPLLRHAIFEPLKDRSFFFQVGIDRFGGLVWPNGADICADWIEAEIAVPAYQAQTA